MKPLILKNNNSVTKSRFIVQESYYLSTNEHRLVCSALAKIDRTRPVPRTIRVSAADFASDWDDVSAENAARNMRDAAKKLYDRSIFYSDDEKEVMCRWIGKKAIFKDGGVELDFIEDIREYLGEIQKDFMQLRMNEISGFSSAYSIRLFELLMQFKSTETYSISVEDLRMALGVSHIKSYAKFCNFNQKVLKVAATEINEKSGWQVDVIEVKKGRSVLSLRFHFHKKNQLELF